MSLLDRMMDQNMERVKKMQKKMLDMQEEIYNENGEGIIEAAIREAREESGYLVKDIEAIGYIIEHRESVRNKHDWNRDISFVFKAIATEKVETNYTEEEISEGFAPIWANINDIAEALSKNEGRIESYSGNFSNKRDLEIVKSVIKSL